MPETITVHNGEGGIWYDDSLPEGEAIPTSIYAHYLRCYAVDGKAFLMRFREGESQFVFPSFADLEAGFQVWMDYVDERVVTQDFPDDKTRVEFFRELVAMWDKLEELKR